MSNLASKFILTTLSAKTASFIVTLVVLVLYFLGVRLLDLLELKTYDMRLLSAGTHLTTSDVAIAAIDEKSLNELGRWPWSRNVIAHIVDRLDKAGASVIAFDIFFSEAENRQVLERIERLESEGGYSAKTSPYTSIKQALAADYSLSQAIARRNKIILSMVFLMSEDETRQLSAAEVKRALASVKSQAISLIKDSGGGKLDFPMAEPKGLIVNLPELQSASHYTGHINSMPDIDGTLRWTPLIMRYQGLFFPAADAQAVRVFTGAPGFTLHTSEYGIEALSLGERTIATDEYGRALIHYYGPEKTFPTYSITDILAGRVDAKELKGKIVLIGATAKGIGDIRVTPYGPAFPGVEIRATIMQNLLHENFIHRPSWMFVLDMVMLLGLGTALSLALPRLGVGNAAILITVLIAVYAGAATHFFRTQFIWVNVTYPTLLMLLLFMVTTVIKYFTTEKEKLHIKSAFQHYVPAKVIDEITRDIKKLSLGGEKRELTVLFSDIRRFTTVAETLSPEELVKLLNVYLTQMTDKVFQHDGLLDKYMGDAVMAVYGAPIYRPDHAKLACRTALDMMAALRALQAQWRRTGHPVLDIGIGINTGPMIVGNMGSQTRFDYTVIGDAVNLGSRIEGMNKVYGTHVLLSEFTYHQVKDEFPTMREVDVTRVRGRNEPVRIYELIANENYPHLDWLDDFAKAYGLFHAGHPKKALPVFEQLEKAVNDPVSRYYAQLCHLPRRRGDDKK